MSDAPLFLYVATYATRMDAEADFDAVIDLHEAGVIGTYDAALVTKSEGKVHVHKVEKPTQRGAWTGIGVGALLGLLFPPSILGAAAVGGLAGGVAGHLWKGMSRGDMKDLGEALDEGEAAVVVMGESKLREQLDKALERAAKKVEKQVNADAAEVEAEMEREAVAR